uniref:Uncharacterized protein n=1 Tax=Tanacetum cinerariifolium TaxID=118510 RepID=A0A699GZJ1_TANCI|nr:hypothetical protein [Tanacetum cinerariifolium]
MSLMYLYYLKDAPDDDVLRVDLTRSRSEPDELAPESSQPVVILKFDIYIYTSTLTLEELNEAINKFSVSLELRPRLPPPELTMNKLSYDVIAERVNLLRKPPTPLLYMCGLTMDCRHPKLSHVIKDAEGKVITVDDFLSLPEWNGTLVSKGDPIPNNERPFVRTTSSLPLGEASLATSKKKRARKNVGLTDSGSEDTIFAAPINHSIPKPLNTATGSKRKEAEVSVVDSSEHTREPTSSIVQKTSEGPLVQEDDQAKNVDVSDDEFFCLDYFDEMISNLATPPENEVLESLTNNEVTASDQVEKIKKLKEDIGPKSKQLSDAESRVQLLPASDEHGVEEEFGGANQPIVYRWLVGREKHKELFTLKCPYIKKVDDSYLLFFGELMNVFPNVPVDATADNPGTSTQYGEAGSSKSKPQETTPHNDDALA